MKVPTNTKSSLTLIAYLDLDMTAFTGLILPFHALLKERKCLRFDIIKHIKRNTLYHEAEYFQCQVLKLPPWIQQIWRHICVSFCVISWLNISEKSGTSPTRFHLSSKPGFCIPLTLNSTKMCWYRGILRFCPAFKVYNHSHRHKKTVFCGKWKASCVCFWDSNVMTSSF